MKNLILFSLFALTIALISSCAKETISPKENIVDRNTNNTTQTLNSTGQNSTGKIPIEDLPAAITDYIAVNYPDATIVKAEREDDGRYEVYLDNGLEIKFDANGNFLEEDHDDYDDNDDSDDDKIAIEDLPAAITDYIAANYPDATIVKAEREDDGRYEVYLDNGLEIKFDANGNFLEEDHDDYDDNDDSDDDKIAIEDLPAAITDYIAANYPDATIIKAEREDDGRYEVYLDNGLEIKFDANGNFLEEDHDDYDDYDDNDDSDDDKIAIEDLPSAITDYIAANYPNATIIKAEREDDGRYEVYLDNGLEIKFDPNGNFLEEDHDDYDDNDDSDDDDDKIAIEDLPSAITDYIAANYPDATIVKAEREDDGRYEVYLDNGLEIKFDPNGNFLEEDRGK